MPPHEPQRWVPWAISYVGIVCPQLPEILIATGSHSSQPAPLSARVPVFPHQPPPAVASHTRTPKSLPFLGDADQIFPLRVLIWFPDILAAIQVSPLEGGPGCSGSSRVSRGLAGGQGLSHWQEPVLPLRSFVTLGKSLPDVSLSYFLCEMGAEAAWVLDDVCEKKRPMWEFRKYRLLVPSPCRSQKARCCTEQIGQTGGGLQPSGPSRPAVRTGLPWVAPAVPTAHRGQADRYSISVPPLKGPTGPVGFLSPYSFLEEPACRESDTQRRQRPAGFMPARVMRQHAKSPWLCMSASWGSRVNTIGAKRPLGASPENSRCCYATVPPLAVPCQASSPRGGGRGPGLLVVQSQPPRPASPLVPSLSLCMFHFLV